MKRQVLARCWPENLRCYQLNASGLLPVAPIGSAPLVTFDPGPTSIPGRACRSRFQGPVPQAKRTQTPAPGAWLLEKSAPTRKFWGFSIQWFYSWISEATQAVRAVLRPCRSNVEASVKLSHHPGSNIQVPHTSSFRGSTFGRHHERPSTLGELWGPRPS